MANGDAHRIATLSGEHVDEAAARVLQVLRPQVDADWSVTAGPLEWSCWQTAEHIAHDLMAYASQIAARPRGDYLPFDMVARPDAKPARLLELIKAAASLVVCALNAADEDMRAWHFGPTDTTGFAAMAVDEMLMHTWDITQGLGVPWRPSGRLCEAVIERLVPEPPPGDPADVLLWATGRIALDRRHPRQTSWTFRISRD